MNMYYCCYSMLQDNFYTPYREVEIRRKKVKISPHGHLEERMKTLRKIEGVKVRLSRQSKPLPANDFDSTGE
jgi:hypothetical protein